MHRGGSGCCTQVGLVTGVRPTQVHRTCSAFLTRTTRPIRTRPWYYAVLQHREQLNAKKDDRPLFSKNDVYQCVHTVVQARTLERRVRDVRFRTYIASRTPRRVKSNGRRGLCSSDRLSCAAPGQLGCR